MATSTRDYYELLGVSRKATDKEIRAAYRKLARQYHPDLNPGNKTAESKFKEIQAAYEVLSDPDKRSKYDQFGHAWERGGQPGPGDVRSGWRTQTQQQDVPFDFGDLGGAEGGDIGDILRGVFGGRGGRPGTQTRTRRGRDLEQPMEISLEEAYQGTTRVLEITSPSGQPRRIEVKIPSGVRDGSRVRVAGEGSPGIGGGPKGDLYLLISLRPHPVFERKGDDIYADVSVPLTVALLGGEVQVTTLKGRVALKIPAESQNARLIRLGGMGMPRLVGPGRGDMFARLRVVLPSGLTPRERELVEEFRQLRPEG